MSSSTAAGNQEADVDDGRLVVVAGVTGADVSPTAATTAAGGSSSAAGVTVEPHEYYGTVATLPDDDGGMGEDDSGGRDANNNKDKAPLLGSKEKDRSKNIELAVVYSTDDSEPIPSVTGDGGTKRRTQEDDGPQIEEEEMTVEEYAGVVLAILKPVSITMLIVIIIIRSLNIPGQNTVGGVFVYQETASDSTSMKFLGSLLNAVIFLGMILVTTVIFVILYKYNCIKIIIGWLVLSSGLMLAMFGGFLFYLLLDAFNLPLDLITFFIILWNFGAVGIIAIFWAAPVLLNQAYLITISFLMATFFTRLPEWTTWCILILIAIYDLFAVLCPKGPLKILVETAQKRQEPLPALLYNAFVFMGMANDETETTPQIAPTNPSIGETATSVDSSADQQGTRKKGGNVIRKKVIKKKSQVKPREPEAKKSGVKLGLGDFIFYSVLIGRAALYDLMTVFTCFVAVVTGLFCTLMLLAVFKKALPALPISIALGFIFYCATKEFLIPFIITLSTVQLFI